MNYSNTTALPGRVSAKQRLDSFNPSEYKRTRNFIKGNVSKLSPYITHGILSLEEVYDSLTKKYNLRPDHKFVNELMWRQFFHHVWTKKGENIFSSLGEEAVPKSFYKSELPGDITRAKTGLAVIDKSIQGLYESGYIHNHARMWLAAYIVHFRKVYWKVGADWMYSLLVDGDLASNHLSWQWVAGTSRSSIYIFNAENVKKYGPEEFCVKGTSLDKSYSELSDLAFSRKTIGNELITEDKLIPFEPPLVKSYPPIDLPDVRDAKLDDFFLIHPWNIGFSDEINSHRKKIGIIFEEFHKKWPWSSIKWNFVLKSMEETCDDIFICRDASQIGKCLSTYNQHLEEIPRFPFDRVNMIFEKKIGVEPEQYCHSFSKYWRKIEKTIK